MRVTIDGQVIELEERLTILQAARRCGIEIPTMCTMEGHEPFNSCMICMVEDVTSGVKVPACSARIADGMEIATQTESIKAFRRLTLDLLLSDHVGDCEAPCRRGCGVGMDIPRLIREVAADELEQAATTLRRDMAIPSVLERLCHAPCETPCRRGKHDEPIAIRHLALYAADWALGREEPFVLERAPDSGKQVVIVGAGPTGLSAAYYLAVAGHACTVLEKEPRALERLRGAADAGGLPNEVVSGELRVLRALGVELSFDREVGQDPSLSDLRAGADAVLLALGPKEPASLSELGLDVGPKGLVVDGTTAMTSEAGVFAAGQVVRSDQRVLRSVASAKRVAWALDQFLRGVPVVGPPSPYDHSMGKLLEGEIEVFVSGASERGRRDQETLDRIGLSTDDARLEAERCMHCDCREKDNCKLRIYSDEYGSVQKHFRGGQRATFEHINQDAGAVFEPGKCIKCGLCVHVTQREGEPYGFAFVGRGFDLKTSIALGRTLPEGLQEVASQVVEACPTGALARNEKLSGDP